MYLVVIRSSARKQSICLNPRDHPADVDVLPAAAAAVAALSICSPSQCYVVITVVMEVRNDGRATDRPTDIFGWTRGGGAALIELSAIIVIYQVIQEMHTKSDFSMSASKIHSTDWLTDWLVDSFAGSSVAVAKNKKKKMVKTKWLGKSNEIYLSI